MTLSEAAQDQTATRRRGAELEEAILDAAWQVLREKGYSGFTYEAIAVGAGTSRPVLYRRWPQRDDLLLATLRRSLWHPIAVPDTGNLRDDALGLLRNANAARSRMDLLVGLQLMDYFRQTGTSMADLRTRLRGPGQPSGFGLLVDRAVARGELPDVPRSPRLTELPIELFRHDLIMTMRAMPDSAIVEIVDEIWLPLLRP